MYYVEENNISYVGKNTFKCLDILQISSSNLFLFNLFNNKY